MNSIYIYGTGGHALVVSDIAKACGYSNLLYIDDLSDKYMSFEDIKIKKEIPIIVAIGNNNIRKRLLDKVKKSEFEIISLIHPNALISNSVIIGKGTVIMPNVVVNAEAKIGDGVILNTACIVEHENIIENFVHISPNVSLGGNVKILKNTHIGIGSSIKEGITVGMYSIIGAGSVLVKDINNKKLAYGNPCIEMMEINE